MSEDRKKYDSQAYIGGHNCRVAKEPQIIEGGDKPMVKLTFPLESRSERHCTLWVEVTVQDRQADLASYLWPGDVLGWEAFPAARKWEDKEGNERISFEGVRCELFPSIELIMQLKERGWQPGANAVKGKGGGKKGGKTTKPAKGGKKARPVQNLDDDDLPADESEEN